MAETPHAAAPANADILGFAAHAPWLRRYSAADVASWRVTLPGRASLVSPNVGEAGEQLTLLEWQAALLGRLGTFDEATKLAWIPAWRAYADRCLKRGNPVLVSFATWWCAFADGKWPEKEFGDDVRIAASQRFEKAEEARERSEALARCADENGLVRAPTKVMNLNAATWQLLERDGGLNWESLLNGCVPTWRAPALTLWCADPVSAAALRHEFQTRSISPIVRVQAPFLCTLSTGWLPPMAAVGAGPYWARLSTAFSFT